MNNDYVNCRIYNLQWSILNYEIPYFNRDDSFEIPKEHIVYGLAALGYIEEPLKIIERTGLIHFVE